MPCIYPLHGKVGIQLYEGRLQIDLEKIAGIIEKTNRIIGEE